MIKLCIEECIYRLMCIILLADLSLCVTVSQIEAFGFELGPYPKVRAWLQKCKDELEPFGYKVNNYIYNKHISYHLKLIVSHLLGNQ